MESLPVRLVSKGRIKRSKMLLSAANFPSVTSVQNVTSLVMHTRHASDLHMRGLYGWAVVLVLGA